MLWKCILNAFYSHTNLMLFRENALKAGGEMTFKFFEPGIRLGRSSRSKIAKWVQYYMIILLGWWLFTLFSQRRQSESQLPCLKVRTISEISNTKVPFYSNIPESVVSPDSKS